MQINDNHKKVLDWVVKVLILFACLFYILVAVDSKWSFDVQLSASLFQTLGIVTLLMFVNWFLEVWRWHYSLNTVQTTSYNQASRQVFVGLALNWIIPFTGGDLVARLGEFGNKKAVGVMIYYNRVIMLSITLFFGAFGIYEFGHSQLEFFVFVFPIGLIALFFVIGRLAKKLLRLDHKLAQREMFSLVLISILRYCVFTIQFYLLITFFLPSMDHLYVFAGIGWVFFFRSVIPSLFGNLGVREASAMLFFESQIPNNSLILIPSLLIWLINTVLPSALGLYFVMKFRVKLAK